MPLASLLDKPLKSKRTVRGIRVPTETVLTPRVIIHAARNLENAALESVIESLISEIDARYGDPDMEPDPAEEEPDKEDAYD